MWVAKVCSCPQAAQAAPKHEMGRAELRFLWAPIWLHSNCKCRLRLTLFGKFITLVFICCERKAPHNILFGIGPMGCKIWWENSWDMSFGPKSELQFNHIEFANLPLPILKPKCHFLTPHNEWMSSWLWPYLPLIDSFWAQIPPPSKTNQQIFVSHHQQPAPIGVWVLAHVRPHSWTTA